MRENSLYGNRETPGTSAGEVTAGRSEKAMAARPTCTIVGMRTAP